MNSSNNVLTENEAAEYVKLSKHTLRMRRFKSIQPTFLKIGRSIRYLQKDLDAFIAASRTNTNF